MSPDRRSRGLVLIHLSATLISIVLAVWISLQFINRNPWMDEFWTQIVIRLGKTPTGVFDELKGDVHPYLYFGVVWLGDQLGLRSIAELRLLNFGGLLLLGLPLWAVVRSKDLPWRGALWALVIYSSADLSLQFTPELRPYQLTFGASAGLAVLWIAFARRLMALAPLAPWLWFVWFVMVAILSNLQYFGCLIAGMLTAVLLGAMVVRGSWRQAAILAIGSALAAAPAVAMVLIQRDGPAAGALTWITTTPSEARWTLMFVVLRAGLSNVVLVAAALVTLFLAVRGRADLREFVPAIGLAAVAGIFFMGMYVANFVQPIVVDRYMVAAAGVLVVAMAAFLASPTAWARGPVICTLLFCAACLYSSVLLLKSYAAGAAARPGWMPTAEAVRAAVGACPATKVYTVLRVRNDGDRYAKATAKTRRYGFAYYAQRVGVRTLEFQPGDRVSPANGCPAILWLEHAQPSTVERFADKLPIPPGTTKTLRLLGSGGLVYVTPAAR